MFGFGAPELIVLLVILLLTVATYKTIRRNNVEITGKYATHRKCHICGYSGRMKTWLRNYSLPQFCLLIGFLFYIIPGLIFLFWGWGKYKCPSCGALAKNSPIETIGNDTHNQIISKEKKCPYCAEDIKAAAIVCKHCQRDIPTA